MSESNLDDTAMTSSSSVTSDVNRVLRLNGAKANNSRYFAFPWKQNEKNDKSPPATRRNNDNDNDDVDTENHSNAKLSNGFLRNIKKRLRIKNINLCKAKQKIKAIDAQRPANEVVGQTSTLEERRLSSNSRLGSTDAEFATINEVDRVFQNPEADACWENYLALGETRDEGKTPLWRSDPANVQRLAGRNERNDFVADGGESAEADAFPIVRTGNVAEPQSTSARERIEVPDTVDAQLVNDCKAKVNLSEELLKLSKYGWYWGPISGDEADSKLVSEPDGAFLVRDSSDDRYLLTLSFKSSGRLLHARMEHSGGLFSLCNQSDNEGFTSVAALIDHSMNSSQSAVFCYSRPRYPGHPSFPVRLTKPVSRFTQVRSLQYLCRFVIRQNTRLDNIHKLPLPKTIRGYIEEAHY